ncbi:uncharacterized protein LOC134185474 [Corticium candelabrum]|uniref:uncharacterized protein LOC134185474 n=1 Tax=Corticium candelabrum TaxID=121492 RepID=UPI002E2637F1|nr:uncharacterized protein LOC134185474 [Corticium candelabrum]
MMSQQENARTGSDHSANETQQVTSKTTLEPLRQKEGGSGLPLLKCKKLSVNAILPTLGSERAAGYDLYAVHDKVIPCHGRELIKTDIAIALPPGCYGRVAPRSGLACKHGVDVGAGVIDPDYRGNVGVLIFNLSDNEYNVKKGDRIAQLVLERFVSAQVEEVEELDGTERGMGGYGSTGK